MDSALAFVECIDRYVNTAEAVLESSCFVCLETVDVDDCTTIVPFAKRGVCGCCQRSLLEDQTTGDFKGFKPLSSEGVKAIQLFLLLLEGIRESEHWMRPLGVTEQQACFVYVFLEQTADHVGLFHDGGRAGGRPQVCAVRLQRLDTTGQKTVLLDGGATHCLRPMRSEEEWERAVETPIFLASGTVTLRQVPGSETLITRDQGTQPIVPLAALVQLGIQVRWDEQGCEMKRSDGSKLPIYLDGGCPVMERWQGILWLKWSFSTVRRLGSDK